MGNSEVGHMNIGAGRVVYQSLTRINIAVREETFYEIPELILEAAAFDAFALTRDQLPNNFQLLLNGQDVLLISIGSSDLELMVFPTVTSL